MQMLVTVLPLILVLQCSPASSHCKTEKSIQEAAIVTLGPTVIVTKEGRTEKSTMHI